MSDRTKEKSRKPAETEKGEQAVIKEDKEGRGENKGKKKNNRSETAGSGGDEITNETDKAGWHDDESETLERNRKIGGKIDLNA